MNSRRAPFCACGCAAHVHRHEHFRLAHCGGCGRTHCPSYLPVNPRLPPRFDDTPNDQRPPSHGFWWFRPYIVTDTMRPGAPTGSREEWLSAWPSGIRYDVRCLDGGAWDRSTWWGSFSTLEDAIQRARARDPLRFKQQGLVR